MEGNSQDPAGSEAYRAPDAALGSDPGLDSGLGADADFDDFDFDDEDFDDEDSDLMRIIGIAGGVAALLGGLMILMGRRRETPQERAVKEVQQAGKTAQKALRDVHLGELLSEARDQANRRLRDAHLDDLARDARKRGATLAREAGKTGRDLADQAGKTGHDLADQAASVAGSVDLEAAIHEIGRRLATIEREGRRGAGRAQKEARKAFKNLDLSDVPDDVSSQLADLWGTVSERAKEIGWADAMDEAGKQVRRLSRQARRTGRNFDLSGLADLLDSVRDQLGSAGTRVQKDVLPAVQGTFEDDVLPEARKRARAAGEALSATYQQARKRGGNLADDYGPQVKKAAGKAAEQAGGLGNQVGEILQAVGMEILHRVLSDVVPGAKKAGARVAETAREDTFPWLRHRAGEVRDRVRDDVAPRVRDFASDAPDRVRGAVDSARPVVADTLSSVGETVSDTVARVRPRVGDAVESGRDRAAEALESGRSGVGGALSTMGRKAGDAAGAAVGTTKYVTGESSRILFWLSMLSGLVLLIFVPDREKQKELWNNMQEFLGELRSMWGDFNDDSIEADDQEYTGDAGV